MKDKLFLDFILSLIEDANEKKILELLLEKRDYEDILKALLKQKEKKK